MVEPEDAQVEEPAEAAHARQHVVVQIELAQIAKLLARQVLDLADAARGQVELPDMFKVLVPDFFGQELGRELAAVLFASAVLFIDIDPRPVEHWVDEDGFAAVGVREQVGIGPGVLIKRAARACICTTEALKNVTRGCCCAS